MIIYGFKQKRARRPKKNKRIFVPSNFHLAGNRKTEALERARDLRSNQTPSEIRTEGVLKYLGIAYKSQYVIFYKRGHYRIVDFYLPEYQKNIEIDGPYHDSTTRYDEYKDARTRYKTIRFSNDETALPNFIDKLKSSIGSKKQSAQQKSTIKTQSTRRKQTNEPLINTCNGYTIQELKNLNLL